MFFLIYNCFLWCFWTRIKIGIAVVEATAGFFVATVRIVYLSFGFALLGFLA